MKCYWHLSSDGTTMNHYSYGRLEILAVDNPFKNSFKTNYYSLLNEKFYTCIHSDDWKKNVWNKLQRQLLFGWITR